MNHPPSLPMRRRAFTLIEIVIMLTIIGLIALFVIPAVGYCRSSSQGDKPSGVVSITKLPGGLYDLATVRHDDHLWVVCIGNAPTSPVHHPDCPCHKALP